MGYQERTISRAPATSREAASPLAVGMSAFAGFLMIMAGIFWSFEGLAAIIEDEFFVIGRNYAYDVDVTAWGWIHLVGGIILAVAGFSVFSGHLWARMLGMVIALAAAVTNFFYIPYYPVWSILIIALCVVIIWALASYNAETDRERAM